MQKNMMKLLAVPLFLASWLVLSLMLGVWHEPFADEAQGFLIARDVPLIKLFTVIARTEGTPVLWFLWLKLLLFFNLSYEKIYLASILPNFIAVALFIYKAPFSKKIRFLFPLTYFILFQYNIIARSYSFLFLAIILTALCWPKRFEHPLRFMASLIFLGSLTAHAFVLASGVFVLYAGEAWQKKALKVLPVAVYMSFVIFSLWLLWPQSGNQYFESLTSRRYWPASNIMALCSGGLVASSNFRPENLPWVYLGIIYFLTSLFFLVQTFPKKTVLLILPNLLFMAFVPYKIWHAGIWSLTVLFILWTDVGPKKLPLLGQGIITLFFIVNLCWSAVAVYREKKEPYSASYDMYNFLISQKLSPEKIAVLSFNAISFYPYFNSSALSYWDWRQHNFVNKSVLKDLSFYQGIITNKAIYDLVPQKFAVWQKQNHWQLKIFSGLQFFGLSDTKSSETLYLFYKDAEDD